MADKEPQFIVTDRRKFTSEGELREGASWTPDEPTPEPTAEPVAPSPAATMPAPSATTVAPAALESAPGPRLVTPAGMPPAAEQEDDLSEEGGPPPTAEEAAEQHAAYQQSSRVLDKMLQDANPGIPAAEEANFEQLVQSIYLSAIVQMGGAAKPGEQPRVDIVGARQNVDILGILADKTKGNLTDRESRLLQNALFDLRMMFLELTNAIAAQAAKPPTGKK
jgi:Domain of unknown function (DUF1844)